MIWKHLRRTLAFPLVSPATLLALASVLSCAFLTLHAAGFRESTSIFSGTNPDARVVGLWTFFCAGTYTLSYLLLVFVVPVLTLAAVVFLSLSAWSASTRDVTHEADQSK
jgi:hypothetical protein